MAVRSLRPPSVVQKGYGPTQLYDPVTRPNGRVLRDGDTGVVFLAPAQTAAEQSSPAASEQNVWFEIAGTATYEMEMEDDDLAVLGRVEIRDSSGTRYLIVDAVRRSAQVTLPSGRYLLNLHASPNLEQAAPVFIRMDEDSAMEKASSNGYRLSRSLKSLPTPPPHGAALAKAKVNVMGCNSCELPGVDLGWRTLINATFEGSDLTGAYLQRINLVRGYLVDANFSGAFMLGANLSQARLKGANFTGANLFAANLLGARMESTNFTGAELTGATWVDGRICKADSIGVCK